MKCKVRCANSTYYRVQYKHPCLPLVNSLPAVTSFAELICPDGKRLVFHQPVSSDFIKAIIG